jgi:hypothetical protein
MIRRKNSKRKLPDGDTNHNNLSLGTKTIRNPMLIIVNELLPNEIFIECFEYLNHLDIFYSLNYRLNKLIQAIPLKINFEHVRKIIFDQMCI